MSDNKLLTKILTNSTAQHSEILKDSKLFGKGQVIQTEIPILNLALSGRLNGGMTAGVTLFAGESKTFKTFLGLLAVKFFQKKHSDGVVLFYNNEYGTTLEAMSAMGIDVSKVIHIAPKHTEDMKIDMVRQLESLNKTDKIMMFVDSLGNTASLKEVEDTKKGESKTDMTRAKQMKALFRLITPLLIIKDVPFVGISHTYETQDLYPTSVVSGGTGGIYAGNSIFIITRSKEKEGEELSGFKFTLNVDKSRFIKEKSKLPINVSFDYGISTWSGLLDLALDTGHVNKTKQGNEFLYSRKLGDKVEERLWKEKETDTSEFWMPSLKSDFPEKVTEMFKLGTTEMVNADVGKELKGFLNA